MTRHHIAASAMALALLSPALQAQTVTTGAASAAAPAAKSTLSSSDADFLKKASLAGHAEVEAGNLALTKAKSPDVRSFAQQMVADHTKVGDELKLLAVSKNLELPDRNSVKSWAQIKAINAGDDDKFDRRYVDTFAVKAHEDTVKLFEKNASNAKDADVKAWAQKTLPGLQHHLEMARTLKSATAAAPAASR